jgi:hypothetical protein
MVTIFEEYGPEWKKEMSKFSKADLIDMIKRNWEKEKLRRMVTLSEVEQFIINAANIKEGEKIKISDMVAAFETLQTEIRELKSKTEN